MKSEFSNENYLFTCMRSLVGFQVWTFGVDLLTIGETTFVDSSLFIIDRWIKTQVCVWQGAFESHGRLCKRNEPGNHFSSPSRHPYDGTPSTIGSGHSHQAGGEGFQRRGSCNMITSLESPGLRSGGSYLTLARREAWGAGEDWEHHWAPWSSRSAGRPPCCPRGWPRCCSLTSPRGRRAGCRRPASGCWNWRNWRTAGRGRSRSPPSYCRFLGPRYSGRPGSICHHQYRPGQRAQTWWSARVWSVRNPPRTPYWSNRCQSLEYDPLWAQASVGAPHPWGIAPSHNKSGNGRTLKLISVF